MKRFKQLRIKGDYELVKKLLVTLKTKKGNVFEYNRTMTEDYAKNIFRDVSDVGCFKTTRVSLYQSCVWVLFDNDHLYIANITSEINASLSKDEYNCVLDSFLKDFVQPQMKEELSNLKVDLRPGNVTMSDLVSTGSYQELSKWQASYDMFYMEEDSFTYSCWIKAVVALIRNKDVIEYDDFRGWLIDDCGWPELLEDKIHNYYLKYEWGKDLLNEWNYENEG